MAGRLDQSGRVPGAINEFQPLVADEVQLPGRDRPRAPVTRAGRGHGGAPCERKPPEEITSRVSAQANWHPPANQQLTALHADESRTGNKNQDALTQLFTTGPWLPATIRPG